jgi:succinoglycan biosynthesis transport protein ExoP
MSFVQFLSILRARWGVMLAVLLLALAAAVAANLLLPRQYTATASVVVDFKPDPVSAVVFGGMASPAFIATQVDIIRSERVALRVVRNLKLAENPQVLAQWRAGGAEGSVEQWLIRLFQRQVDVVPARESSVIALSYKAPDPRFAAALANAFVAAYIDTALELRVDPARQYAGFFETRSREARDALEKAQARLSAFQKDNGIVASDERLDVESARLNELSSQLTTLQAISAESGSRQAQAQGAQGDRLQEVLNNNLIGQLKGDISRGEAQLQQLTTRLGDNHPQVMELRASLAEMRNRLDTETRKLTGSVSVSNSINRQREGEIRAALEAQRAKVLKMKATRDEGLILQREVESAQRAFEAISARLTQTSLESQTTQSNVNVLTRAEPPLEPSSPRVMLNLLAALFGGLLLAVVAALLAELRDRRVRTTQDLAALLDLPVIGVMPRPKARRPVRALAGMPIRQRLLAPLPRGGKGP